LTYVKKKIYFYQRDVNPVRKSSPFHRAGSHGALPPCLLKNIAVASNGAF